MIVIEKNAGPKIPYEVEDTKITFDDELTLKLAKLQKDDPVHKTICYDEDGDLMIGTAGATSPPSSTRSRARATSRPGRSCPSTWTR